MTTHTHTQHNDGNGRQGKFSIFSLVLLGPFIVLNASTGFAGFFSKVLLGALIGLNVLLLALRLHKVLFLLGFFIVILRLQD